MSSKAGRYNSSTKSQKQEQKGNNNGKYKKEEKVTNHNTQKEKKYWFHFANTGRCFRNNCRYEHRKVE